MATLAESAIVTQVTGRCEIGQSFVSVGEEGRDLIPEFVTVTSLIFSPFFLMGSL